MPVIFNLFQATPFHLIFSAGAHRQLNFGNKLLAYFNNNNNTEDSYFSRPTMSWQLVATVT